MFFKSRKDKADNNNVLGRLISKLSSQPSSTGDREYTELRSRHKEYLLRASQESNPDCNGDDSDNAGDLSSTERTASTNAMDTTPAISSSHLRKKLYIDSTDGVLSTEQYSSDGALPLNSEMPINPSDSELPESEPEQKSIDGSGLESIDMESCEEKTDDTTSS